MKGEYENEMIIRESQTEDRRPEISTELSRHPQGNQELHMEMQQEIQRVGQRADREQEH